MKRRIYTFFSVSTLILLACGLSSPTPSGEDTEDTEPNLEDRIALTSAANQTATAEVEKAIQDALELTAAAATDTPEATDTPIPTDTPEPTDTATPSPTATTSSGGDPTGYVDCKDSGGGRTKVRVENKTGDTAYMSFYGPETHLCYIPGGVHQIFIKSGSYTVSVSMCGATFNFGSHPINSTWKLVLTCP